MPPKPIQRAKMSLAGAKRSGYNRDKLKNGIYLVRCTGVRVGPDRPGLGFHLDFSVKKVISAFDREEEKGGGEWPTSNVGAEASWVNYPFDNKAGGGYDKADIEAKEKGKIMVALGAVMGYGKNELGFFEDDAVFDSCVAYYEKDRKPTYTSPLVGREFVVVARPCVRRSDGKDSNFYEFEPSDTQPALPPGPVGETETATETEAAPAPEAEAPPAPPADEPAPPVEDTPSFEELAAAAGWIDRAPTYPGWWYNAREKKQLKTDALRAALGA